ncbi:Uncharacterised protein [Chryseobacterium nakagawai]|uniref:LysM domain-containing protein n=1 Tax=Chryseobacterium nakagawai TaxID=1241982 RepID=A0AAD1DNU8_CHRNA|nr:hypothetical protein [Chryseobacterium nakagawai]AZA89762.1 hypothetical protein EG343_03525 [Chryseobacterium nakagawai]VEH21154.1 Uncharacterised protein [Chryseobacterium nakagawai]
MKKNISDRKDPIHTTDPINKQNFYAVKSGETLESIALDLMLENPRYLLEYHNQRCSFLDTIPENGRLRLMQKLCIPAPEEISEINTIIQERGESVYKSFSKGKIPFNAEAVSGVYKVRQTESDDGILKSEYAYSIYCNYIKEEEKGYRIHFSMSDFTKDGEELEQKINSLASAFVKIIYPVTFIIDRSGKLVAAETHKEIRHIINEIEALKKYHQGSYASLHINQMKDKMAHPKVIYSSLKTIVPVQFIFSSFYQAHYNIQGFSVPYTDEFSWLAPASPIRMEIINQTLSEEKSGCIEVVQTGKSVDYRTVEELYDTDWEYDELEKPHSKSLIASHSAIYTLKAADFSIQKIKAGFHIQMADYEKSMTFELEKLAG